MTYHYIWEALVQLSKESGGCTNPPDGEPDCYHCQLLGLAADVEKLGIRAEAAEADLLAVRETLANVIDERDDARAEVERLRKALNLIDAARAEAVAEIETVHRYLDECFVNDPDQGRAVPLVDRVVLLVSKIVMRRIEDKSVAAIITDAELDGEQDETPQFS